MSGTATRSDAQQLTVEGEVIRPKTLVTRSSRSGTLWRAKVLGGQFLVVVVFLGVWQLVSGRVIPAYLISSPIDVVKKTVDLLQTGVMWGDIGTTTQELVIGYVIGVVAGLLIGVLLGSIRYLSGVFEPLIAAINGIPKIALAPLFLLWFGLGIWSKVAQASMIVFFVMYYNVFMGMLNTPRSTADLLRVMGASPRYVIRRVVIPSVSVPMFTGLKASVPFAMIGVIVGEFIAADKGVGYYVLQATEQYDAAGLFAGIIIMVAMVLIGMKLVQLWENRALRWQRISR